MSQHTNSFDFLSKTALSLDFVYFSEPLCYALTSESTQYGIPAFLDHSWGDGRLSAWPKQRPTGSWRSLGRASRRHRLASHFDRA